MTVLRHLLFLHTGHNTCSEAWGLERLLASEARLKQGTHSTKAGSAESHSHRAQTDWLTHVHTYRVRTIQEGKQTQQDRHWPLCFSLMDTNKLSPCRSLPCLWSRPTHIDFFKLIANSDSRVETAGICQGPCVWEAMLQISLNELTL